MIAFAAWIAAQLLGARVLDVRRTVVIVGLFTEAANTFLDRTVRRKVG